MIRSLLRRSFVWLLALAGPLTADVAPLPVTVFKNLNAGKKQSVVTYGTSLTIGGAWSKALHDYFDREFPGQVTFANAAKGGMTSVWGVENLQRRVLDRRPDLVFIEFSANDAATKHGISREQSEANLDRMVKALRAQNPQVDIVLQTMNPAWDSPANPAKKYASDRPELEAYYDVYRGYARANRLPLADHFPHWAKLRQEDRQRFEKAVSDGIHPHSGPSLAVTWPVIRELLEKARAAATGDGTAAVKVVIIGDSTVCEYAPTRPDRGWGQFVGEHFRDGSAELMNLAKAGRSTKTFLQEGWWKQALAAKPGYVLIQFGHNDSHAPDRPESTDAATAYKDFLRRYIDDSRAIAATPILVTPVARRTFAADGTLEDTLQPYADAMKEVAKEKDVAVIDLHASSRELVARLGPDKSAKMANKAGDKTHFNEHGARAMAELVMKELPVAAPELKELLITP